MPVGGVWQFCKEENRLNVYPENEERTELADSEEAEFSAHKGYDAFKRVLDVVLSILALMVLLLPILIIALAVFIDDPHGSPFYVSTRCGKNGKEFRFYKLRSMCVGAEDQLVGLLENNEADGPVFKIKGDPRITRVGRFIRKCSIDELPQLLNIIKGDMSIVGPRPPIPREVELYTPEQMKRLAIRPGLTCYWQVQPHRNDIPFDEWVQMDLKYIRERSLLVDAKIILRTVKTVLMGEGQ